MDKKIIFLLFLLINMTAKSQKFITKNEVDKQGFNYETVLNDPTQTRIYTLKNGLKVYLSKNNDAPRIQTFIPVKTGSSNDPADNTGLAHYLEHMMFKGTSKIETSDWLKEKPLLEKISNLYEQHKAEQDPEKKKLIYKKIDSISQEASKIAVANEYDKLISTLGATGTNAHTWLEETVYKNNIPSNELEKWLMVEKERFSELVLRLFHTELEAVYEEFNRSQDDDSRLVNYTLMDALFPTHPYGQQTTIGKAEHLKNPSMVAIHKYFDTYYVPNNMAIVLVGDLDYDKTIYLVNKYFGSFQYKELPKENHPKEKPLTSVISREVNSPTAERLQIAFRTAGAGTKEALYAQMVDMILSNRGAGLIDLNINRKQKLQGATSSVSVFKEYGMHSLIGVPREGQNLDDVKQILLSQLDEVKKGNFEEWLLPAIVNDLKTQRIKNWDRADRLASEMYNAFIQNQSWESILNELNDASKITKADIVKFANDFYKDDYVIVYKRKGVNDKLVRVEKPEITPIQINREQQSAFYKEFAKIPEEEIKPVFVDYKKEIQTSKVANTELFYIPNKNNDLFELFYIFDMGIDNDRKFSLALNYLDFIGTDKYSREDIEKEFYKIGISYNIKVQTDKIYVSLQGLEENLPKGVQLLEHLLSNAVPDNDAYQKYVESILKGRNDAKLDKRSIFNALQQYSRYGENNRLRDNIPSEELKNMDLNLLISKIKNLNNYKHQIFYYGENKDKAEKALKQYHNFGKGELAPEAKKYTEKTSEGNIYFAPYDMVQAEILFQSKGDNFDPSKLAFAKVYNEYFGSGLSSIVFQEIRESKSLAYSAYSVYAPAMEKDKPDYLNAYIGTQSNKLPLAVNAMNGLMNDMPEIEKQFENAKQGALKQIASERITKSSVFWSYQSALKRGYDYDIRKDMYNKISSMTLPQLKEFFNQNIKGKKFDVNLLGKKENLNWEAVEKLDPVKELSIDDLFNYN